MDTPSSDQSALKGVDGPGGDMGGDDEMMINLPDDMLSGSGLENAESGDTYSFTVKAKKGDAGWEVLSIMDGKEDGGEDAEDKSMLPKSRSLSPKESGMEMGMGGDE